MNNDALAGFLFAEMIKEIYDCCDGYEFEKAIEDMAELGCDALPQNIDHSALNEIERVFVKAVTKYNNKEGVW